MRTHLGEEIKGIDLEIARIFVAEEFRQNARAIQKENAFASHVTEDEKSQILKRDLIWADAVECGEHDHNLTVWQMMNIFITGECVALLP